LTSFTLGLGVTIFGGYLAAAAVQDHKALVDSLAMRIATESMIGELQRKNAQHESREIELRDAREKPNPRAGPKVNSSPPSVTRSAPP